MEELGRRGQRKDRRGIELELKLCSLKVLWSENLEKPSAGERGGGCGYLQCVIGGKMANRNEMDTECHQSSMKVSDPLG